MFSSVVLPLPLSPMMATYSPFSTVKFTSLQRLHLRAAEACGVNFLNVTNFQKLT